MAWLPQKPSPSQSSSSGDADKDPIATYLEELTYQVLDAHNTIEEPKSQALLRSHCSADFQMLNASLHECPIPASKSLEDHIANMIAFKKANPSWYADVNNATGMLEQGGKEGVVWLTERGCGASSDRLFNRESVSMLYWRLEEGVWKWYKHYSLRGGGDLFAKG